MTASDDAKYWCTATRSPATANARATAAPMPREAPVTRIARLMAAMVRALCSSAMKLYVCYGTFSTPRPGGHPCKNAYDALREAGHDPQVVKSYGLALLPDAIANRTSGREAAKRLTGKSTVPILELDDGTAVADSAEIVAWARANPAAAAAA